MMTAALLWIAVFFVYLPIGTWIHYLAIMHLQHVRDTAGLPVGAHALGVVTLASGYTHDFLLNVIHGSLILFDIPRETTLTARLKRHKFDDGWRGDITRWLAGHLLDPFDPDGRHI